MTASPLAAYRPDPVAARRSAEEAARAAFPWLRGSVGEGWVITRGDSLEWNEDEGRWVMLDNLILLKWDRKDGES